LWPSWSWCVAVMVCGRHGCGRPGLWPSWYRLEVHRVTSTEMTAVAHLLLYVLCVYTGCMDHCVFYIVLTIVIMVFLSRSVFWYVCIRRVYGPTLVLHCLDNSQASLLTLLAEQCN